MAKLKVTISGMHCASCGTNVEKVLKKVQGIKEVTVSVLTKKAFVETTETVNPEDIKKAVSKIGYKVVAVESA